MELTWRVAGMPSLRDLLDWRGVYDFEAPGLATRERLARLEYAASQARRQQCDPWRSDELDFILEECRALQAMESLEGEVAERERVGQRVERVRRVVVYNEGLVARLNRRCWWLPFSVALLAMVACGIRPLLRL